MDSKQYNTKNILILITKGESGGAQTSVFNLAKKLKEQNIPVTVGFGEGIFLEKKLSEYNINQIRFSNLQRNHSLLNIIIFIIKLKKYLKKNNFSTIHFNSTNTLLGVISTIFLPTKPKTVFTFRGLSILDQNYTKSISKKILYWLIFKFLLYFVDEQVYVSQENLEQATKMHINNKGTVIYNGLDENYLEFFNKDSAITKLKDKIGHDLNDKFIIGSIGRLSYQKNYEFLIDNFHIIQKVIPKAILIIIGTGPNEEKIKDKIKQLNLEQKIFLTGDIFEAHKYLKVFDIFILSARYEGLPIVLLETLFAGIPALCSNVNGNNEVIGNSGLVFDLNNINDFEKKLEIIKEDNFRKNASVEALSRSKMFMIENTISQYLKIYS